jgi:malic enzyme
MNKINRIDRRKFIAKGSAIVAGTTLAPSLAFAQAAINRKRVAIIGTGSRGSGTWGKSLFGPYIVNHSVIAK